MLCTKSVPIEDVTVSITHHHPSARSMPKINSSTRSNSQPDSALIITVEAASGMSLAKNTSLFAG